MRWLGWHTESGPVPFAQTLPFSAAQLGKWGRQMQGQRWVSPKQSHSPLHFHGKLKQFKKRKKKREEKKKEKKKKAVVFSPQQESQCEQPLSDKMRVGGWASLSLFLSAWGSQQRPYALILDIFSLLSSLQHASSSIKQY